uniref:Bm10760 n=1 Tax=Brugia malayi TaxID=6279 RepID=A0A0J9Y0Y2_BRUMA|nr:Bm10760 [Brugia malayi]
MVPSVSSYSSPKKLLLHASILRHLQLFIGFCILPSNIPYTYCVVCIGMLWDAFAVPASIGPLRRISGKAHEYSDQVTILSLTPTNRSHEIYNIAENIRMEKETKAAFSKLIIQTSKRCLVEPKQQKEAKSKHIQQRKALGHKSNICDETIRKICTKLGTSGNKRKKRNLKSTML